MIPDIVSKAIDKVGSPLYVYDLDMIGEAAMKLRQMLPQPCRILYSVKANSHPLILEKVRGLGIHFEVSSGGELSEVCADNVTHDMIVCTSPGKTDEFLYQCLILDTTVVSVESKNELLRIVDLAKTHNLSQKILIRIRPTGKSLGGRLRMTGTSTQFGFDESDFSSVGAILRKAPELELLGFHVYSASNCLSETSLIEEFDFSLKAVVEACNVLKLNPTMIDLGGGFPAPFAIPGALAQFEVFETHVANELDSFFPEWRVGKPKLLFESGRYLVGTSGSLFMKVVDVKKISDKNFVVLDGGINVLGGMSGLGRLHFGYVEPEFFVKSRKSKLATLVGPMCTPLDIVAREIDVPAEVDIGDFIRIPNVGAYGLRASLMGFLNHQIAAEAIICGGKLLNIRRLALRSNEECN